MLQMRSELRISEYIAFANSSECDANCSGSDVYRSDVGFKNQLLRFEVGTTISMLSGSFFGCSNEVSFL